MHHKLDHKAGGRAAGQRRWVDIFQAVALIECIATCLLSSPITAGKLGFVQAAMGCVVPLSILDKLRNARALAKT